MDIDVHGKGALVWCEEIRTHRKEEDNHEEVRGVICSKMGSLLDRLETQRGSKWSIPWRKATSSEISRVGGDVADDWNCVINSWARFLDLGSSVAEMTW